MPNEYIYLPTRGTEGIISYSCIPRNRLSIGPGIGLIAGGRASPNDLNSIEYITFSTLGTTQNFGKLTMPLQQFAGVSNNTRGVFAGGQNSLISWTTSINYNTLSTTGDSTNFGNLITTRSALSGLSNSLIGIFSGGFNGAELASAEYVTIATEADATNFSNLSITKVMFASLSSNIRGLTAGGTCNFYGLGITTTIDYLDLTTRINGTNFGNLTVARSEIAGVSDGTRGIFGGGRTTGSTRTGTIDYITIATTGNATDWGSLLTTPRSLSGSMSNSIIGLFAGGRNSALFFRSIEYITISTLGSIANFGNLNIPRFSCTGISDSHGGLIGSSVVPVVAPSLGSSTGLIAGGYHFSTAIDLIDYINITTASNATNFGLLVAKQSAMAGTSNTTKGVFAGGDSPFTTTMQSVTIATTGNASSFGNLMVARGYLAGTSNSTKGVFIGGYNGLSGPAGDEQTMDYITFASLAGAAFFGNLLPAAQQNAGLSSTTRGVFAMTLINGSIVNLMDFITFATLSNSNNFGSLSAARYAISAAASNTIGVFAGGWDGASSRKTDYITISTTGVATAFGNLTVARQGLTGTSNNIRGVFAGGFNNIELLSTIDAVTFSALTFATDFGDLTVGRDWVASCSNSHGGL